MKKILFFLFRSNKKIRYHMCSHDKQLKNIDLKNILSKNIFTGTTHVCCNKAFELLNKSSSIINEEQQYFTPPLHNEKNQDIEHSHQHYRVPTDNCISKSLNSFENLLSSSVDNLFVPWQNELDDVRESNDDDIFIHNKLSPNGQQNDNISNLLNINGIVEHSGVNEERDFRNNIIKVDKSSTLILKDDHQLLHQDNVENKARINDFPQTIQFPPSLGIGSPGGRRGAAKKVELPIWLQKPTNPILIPEFVERLRKRLILIERRLHYLKNEKRVLLSCLWSYDDNTIQKQFPDVSKHSPIEQRLHYCNTCDDYTGISFKDKTNVLLNKTKHKDYLPNYFADSFMYECPIPSQYDNEKTLWNAARSIKDDLLDFVQLDSPIMNTNDMVLGPDNTSGSLLLPVSISGNNDITELSEVSLNAARLNISSPTEMVCIGGTDWKEKDQLKVNLDFLKNLAIQKREEEKEEAFNAVIKSNLLTDDIVDNVSVKEDDLIDSVLDVASNDHDSTNLLNVSKTAQSKKKRVLKKKDVPCTDLELNKLQTDNHLFTKDYWMSLTDSQLRQWMKFFGMKSKVTRRSLMLKELIGISDYIFNCHTLK